MMQLTLQSPYDMHLHLRDTPMLEAVAKYTARYFSGALVMPNLNPPVDCLDLALAYKERILKAVREKRVNFNGGHIRLSADFPIETLQARRKL